MNEFGGPSLSRLVETVYEKEEERILEAALLALGNGEVELD